MSHTHDSPNAVILARIERLWAELQRARHGTRRYDEIAEQIRHEADAFQACDRQQRVSDHWLRPEGAPGNRSSH
jgi:hypothetical protein